MSNLKFGPINEKWKVLLLKDNMLQAVLVIAQYMYGNQVPLQEQRVAIFKMHIMHLGIQKINKVI